MHAMYKQNHTDLVSQSWHKNKEKNDKISSRTALELEFDVYLNYHRKQSL